MENIREDLIDLVTEMVQIYSPYFEEEHVMEYVFKWFKHKDIPAKYHSYSEDRITKFKGTNIVGSIKGEKPGKTILLNGHLDTVSITRGWTKDPLKPSIEGDKLYGLGALDMKGGSAAIMLAVEAFHRNVKDFKGEIIYTLVSDEEGPYGLGTDAVILDDIADNIDIAIVPEPSAGFCDEEFPCLCLGARGGYNYTVEIIGRASHASTPELGINAILEGAKLMAELENTEFICDDKLGKGSTAIIDAKGGGAAASGAEKFQFTVFRHTVRGENKDTIRDEIKAAADRAGLKADYQVIFRDSPHTGVDGFKPYIVEEDDPYVEIFQNSIKKIMGRTGKLAYFSSIGDFNYLGTRTDASTFIFGASGENYHAADEWVSVDSLVNTTKIIYDLLVNLTQ